MWYILSIVEAVQGNSHIVRVTKGLSSVLMATAFMTS